MAQTAKDWAVHRMALSNWAVFPLGRQPTPLPPQQLPQRRELQQWQSGDLTQMLVAAATLAAVSAAAVATRSVAVAAIATLAVAMAGVGTAAAAKTA